jgi:hypothetical protein
LIRASSSSTVFPYYYAASMPVGDERRIIYCEHGNQVDPANVVEDYRDRLDTPLGYHVVTDFTRRVAPFGEISGGLDLSELAMVYPLVTIPRWVASRYFYDFIGKALAYLLLPLLGINAAFRVISYLRAHSRGEPSRGVVGDLQGLPGGRTPLIAFAFFSLTNLALFAIFFLVVRRAVRKALESMSPDEGPGYRPEDAQGLIKEMLRGDTGPPMAPSADPKTIDVFVYGHTHMPALTEMERRDGRRAVIVNSGCFLRQLNPISPRLKGPPVFVSRFVLTHARVYAGRLAARGAVGAPQARTPEAKPYRTPPVMGAQAARAPFGREPSRAGLRHPLAAGRCALGG